MMHTDDGNCYNPDSALLPKIDYSTDVLHSISADHAGEIPQAGDHPGALQREGAGHGAQHGAEPAQAQL